MHVCFFVCVCVVSIIIYTCMLLFVLCVLFFVIYVVFLLCEFFL